MPRYRYTTTNAPTPLPELRPLVDAAEHRLTLFLQRVESPLVAFSGGKDSIVVAHLARRIGIERAVCELGLIFEETKPEIRSIAEMLGLVTAYYDSVDEDWLRENSKYLFPDTKTASQFYALLQQRTVKRHALQNPNPGLVFGRRREENSVRSELYQTANGIWNVHPLIDWSTEDIWGYIRHHKLPVPRLYSTELGRLEGMMAWPMMNVRKVREFGFDPWQLVFDVDPDVVRRVASWDEDARAFLQRV